MMGFSGIWLNHRDVLKLNLPSVQQSRMRLPLPDPAPATAAAMAAWLQDVLKVEVPPHTVKVDRARPVAWADGERSPMQPERWFFDRFGAPNKLYVVEYWAGNRSVSVSTTNSGFIATLTNLHMGRGMPIAWILLIDTLAGSLIFLSISGVILWVETNRRRLIGLSIFGVAVTATLTLALAPVRF